MQNDTSLLFKNPDSIVSKEDPWCDDLLDRKHIAKLLTNIISSLTQPFVIGIDSSFGSGKTFFIKRWAEELKNNDANVIYFNAWESDFSDDPLMAFIAELDQNLLKNDDAKKACIDLLKNMGRNVVEKTSLGLIKASDLDKLTKNRLSAFIDAKNEIDSFKDTLRVYGQQLRKKDKENRPVIIFIDELDRCRPNYAIEILEIIKHLFDIENYVFCLAIDKKQLISSIGTVYGTTLDGEAYLRKFIEWNYKLPDPEPENFIEYLIEKFNLDEVYHTTFDKDDHTCFPKILTFYSRVFSLRLRDIERHFTSYNIIARSIPANQPHFPRILSLLIILRDKNLELYKEYCLNSGNEEKLHSYMESLLASNNQIDKDFYKEKVYPHIIAGSNNSDTIYFKQEKAADRYNKSQSKGDKEYFDTLERARRIYGNLREWPSPGDTIANYLYKYIETVKN